MAMGMGMALAAARKGMERSFGAPLQQLRQHWAPMQEQQVRGVYVDVKGINFEQALSRYGRKLRQDKTLNDLLKKQFYMKPSEKRVLAKKERDKRISRKDFKMKLRWIMRLRAQGL